MSSIFDKQGPSQNKKALKIALSGDATTGKSSIAFRLMYNQFKENLESTVGASFFTKRIDDIQFNIWDTAGQERFLSLVQMYYRGSDFIVIVFDLSKPRTLDRLKYYISCLKNERIDPYKIIVVGNKMDLVGSNDLGSIKSRIEICLKDYPEYLEKIVILLMSAKTGENFDQFVGMLVKDSVDILNRREITETQNIVNLTEPDQTSYLDYCKC